MKQELTIVLPDGGKYVLKAVQQDGNYYIDMQMLLQKLGYQMHIRNGNYVLERSLV